MFFNPSQPHIKRSAATANTRVPEALAVNQAAITHYEYAKINVQMFCMERMGPKQQR